MISTEGMSPQEVNLGARIGVLQLLARQPEGQWYDWDLFLSIGAEESALIGEEREWVKLAMKELEAQGYVELQFSARRQRRLTPSGREHLEHLLAEMASKGRFPAKGPA